MGALKDLQSYLILDQEVENELKSFRKKFAFIHLFFNQYSKVMKRVHLIAGKQEEASNDYHKNIRNLSWILFIMQRRNSLFLK